MYIEFVIPDILRTSRLTLAAIILTCLIPGVQQPLTAQKEYHFFFGKVVDKTSQSGLPDVNIAFQGLKNGTVTDQKGMFSFFLDTIPIYIVISHIGYETKKIYLDGVSNSVAIQLTPVSRMLQEVEIKAKSDPETFFKDHLYSVLDYMVDSMRVYLLIYRFKKSESVLLCKTTQGDKVAGSAPLSVRPDRLFKDCLGYIHLITSDSSYQVFRSDSMIFLTYPASMDKFNEILENCVASTDKYLFFQHVIHKGMTIEYYHIDRLTSRKNVMSQASDDLKLRMLRLNPDDNALLSLARPPGNRDDFVQWSYAKKVLYRPNTSSLHKVGNQICIFNTSERSIEFYTTEGEFTSKLLLPVLTIKEGKWTGEVCIDEITSNVYTLFMKNGHFFLYRINLETGSLKRELEILHAYPEKIRIHNQLLYYLYDIPGTSDNKHLFRQKL